MFARFIALAGSVAAVLVLALSGSAQASASDSTAAREIHASLKWDRHCLIGTLDGTYHDADRAICSFDMADQVYRSAVLAKTAKTAKARKVFASVAKQVNALRADAQFGDREKAAHDLKTIRRVLVPLFAA